MATKDTDTDPDTFTAMSMGDVDAIGAHCEAPFCHQLDFLPFKCESCKGKYCLDHRTETAHNCPRAGAWAAARRQQQQQSLSQTPLASKPTILTHDQQCSRPDCKTLINTPLVQGIHCDSCQHDYCLRHRLKEDHNCAKIPRPKRSDANTTAATALSKLRSWGASKRASIQGNSSSLSATNSPKPSVNITTPLTRTSTSSTSATEPSAKLSRIVSPFKASRVAKPSAAAIQLNSLKKTAKGDAKILAEARVYVHLEAVAEGEGVAGATVPSADAFYSKEWSVGKVLDAAAKTLAVTNVNNRGGGEEERLRVYHVDGGRLLGFAEKLGGSGVKNGDTLVLLRGVGAAEAAS